MEASSSDPVRDQAIQSLKKKRDFKTHLLMFVAVNAVLVVIWALTNPDGLFWPIFPILGWGIGVVFNIWDVYMPERMTEERIQREMQRLGKDR